MTIGNIATLIGALGFLSINSTGNIPSPDGRYRVCDASPLVDNAIKQTINMMRLPLGMGSMHAFDVYKHEQVVVDTYRCKVQVTTDRGVLPFLYDFREINGHNYIEVRPATDEE